MKRYQIQVLREAGLSRRSVAERAGVHESTVKRVESEDPISDPSDWSSAKRSRMGRPSKVAPFEEGIRSWLGEEPELSSGAILERLREAGYDGGKSAVYEFVRGLRSSDPDTPVVARFEGLPGEFSQHDFGEVVVRYLNGSSERLHFFVSRLKYSRTTRVRITADQKTESICHSLTDAFEYFGGIPLESVFDNPKTIVIGRKGDQVEWQETFASFCVEAGIVPRLTWPKSPEQKGSVENGVGFAKSNFFKVHRFRDREDLLEKLEAWHVRINDERPSRATGQVPRERLLEELPRMRSISIPAGGFRLRYSRIVRTDGFVDFESVRFFVGRSAVAQTVTLHVGEHIIEIYASGKRVAEHPRRPVNGKYSVQAKQREELLEKRGARPYLKRQLLQDLCPAAEWFLTELRHRRPLQWTEEVDRLFELLEEHGELKLRDAFVEAGRRSVVGSEYVDAILSGHAGEEVES